MQDYYFKLGEGVLYAPAWSVDLVVTTSAAIGAVLWMFGRRLVRPAMAAIGLLGGALLMLLASQVFLDTLLPSVPWVFWVFLGAVFGAIISFWMWRVGVGLAAGILVALLAPTLLHLGGRIDGPPIHTPVVQVWHDIHLVMHGVTERTPPENLPDMAYIYNEVTGKSSAAMETWWLDRTSEMRWIMMGLSLSAAFVAMMVGFVFPYASASYVTPIIGSLMILPLPYRIMLYTEASVDDFLPTTPTWILIYVLVLALFGTLFQWVFPGRRVHRVE